MTLVQMKCPNCGGAMKLENNQFVCTNCRTMMLNIIDAKIDFDVTIMSPEEFLRKIEESKRQFIVNINDKLQVFDVNTMVINKKIKDATERLSMGDFSSVMTSLSGVSHDVLSAERLRYLASFNVKSEYELSYYDGYVDNDPHYINIVRLANEQTRSTYQTIAKYCREKYDTKKHIESEIVEAKKLIDNELFQEAIAYTKEMCRRYPYTAMSWASACEVKCIVNNRCNYDYEFTMMTKCPDYNETELPEALKKRIVDFSGTSKSYIEEHNYQTSCIGGIVGGLWGALALIVVLVYIGLSSPSLEGVLSILSLGDLILIGCAITGFIELIKSTKRVKKLKKSYNSLSSLVPNQIKEEYKVVFSDNTKRTLYIFMILAWLVALYLAVKLVIVYL